MLVLSWVVIFFLLAPVQFLRFVFHPNCVRPVVLVVVRQLNFVLLGDPVLAVRFSLQGFSDFGCDLLLG